MAKIYIIPTVLSFFYIYLTLAGNIFVYTPNEGTTREKYFDHIIYKGKDADSGGKQTLFRPLLPSRTASFPSCNGKSTGPIRRKRISKWLFPRRHKK